MGGPWNKSAEGLILSFGTGIVIVKFPRKGPNLDRTPPPTVNLIIHPATLIQLKVSLVGAEDGQTKRA